MNTQHKQELRDAFETAAKNFGYGALQKHDDGRYLWAPTYHAWNGFQLGIKHAEKQRDELFSMVVKGIECKGDLINALEAIKRGHDNPCHIANEAIAKAGG